MFGIKDIRARQILDSRGNPTVECEVCTESSKGIAAVPSGASVGIHEALELRDNKKEYQGKGVLRAVENINRIISKKLIGIDVRHQEEIDTVMIKLDATASKKKLGANAMLAVSLACARCAANQLDIPLYRYLAHNQKARISLPTPFMNVINGGRHADNGLQFQEYMIAPKARTFAERLRIGTETYHVLKGIIKNKFGANSTNVGDEGGFAPNLNRVEEPLKLLSEAAKKAGYSGKVKFAIDAASSEFYNAEKKQYLVDDKWLSSRELMEVYARLIKKYPIISIEDGFAQDDWESWIVFTRRFGKKIQIVGDDFLVTNPERIRMAIRLKACNALLLKVNQIGTLTEAITAARLAMQNKWKVMVSHRSGETSDTFIADLAVALSCGQIKSGAPSRSERVEKYNQLLRIEEDIKGKR